MTRTLPQDGRTVISNVPVILHHIRWVLTLAKLKEIRQESTATSKVREVANHLPGNLFEPSYELDLTMAQWKAFFCGDRSPDAEKNRHDLDVELKITPVNTVYQCTCFYGLDSPNNLAQRFLDDIRSGNARRHRSKYDEHITAWGTYATQLVQENDGWDSFSQTSSLREIHDIWPTNKVSKEIKESSFIERILCLEENRYVQVLTSSVGVLWPLWILKQPRHSSQSSGVIKSVLERIGSAEGPHLRIGDPLPNKSLYIDVNPRVGDYEGLPYPFGQSDRLLREGLGKLGKDSDSLHGTPWPTEAINPLKTALRDIKWCPPILFGTRPDQVERPDEELTNYAVSLMLVSRPCEIFTGVYARIDTIEKPLRDSKIACENQSWSHKKLAEIPDLDIRPLPRREMFSDFSESNEDIVFSYFPVDLLLQTNQEFRRLGAGDVYEKFGQQAEELLRPFAATVLAGGAFLSRQPRMKGLLVDLSLYIQKIDALFRHLKPSFELLAPDFHKLLYGAIEEKKESASKIEQACAVVARKSRLGQHSIVETDEVRKQMTRVCLDICQALSIDDQVPGRIVEHVEGWAWARLFQYISYTWIYVSHELFRK